MPLGPRSWIRGAGWRERRRRGAGIGRAARARLASRFLGGLARLLLRLQTLGLRGTRVTAAALPFVPLTVRHLELTDSRVGEDGCRALPPLSELRKIDLNGLPLTDLSLDSLPALPRLEHIELDRTKVTAAGVRRLLERFPGLRRVEIRDTALSDDALAELRHRFPAVELVVDSGPRGASR